MQQNDLCIAIPAELQEYKKTASQNDSYESKNVKKDFGVKLIKDEYDNLVCAAYYSDSGEIIKKIFYQGSSISSIEHYRNGTLFTSEIYDNGKIKRKIKFNSQGIKICSISYEYNRHDQITAIRKYTDNTRYAVVYGYDELKRVNSRQIKENDTILIEQNYRYDILDRIVEFKDNNQKIEVHKVNQNNSLVSYTVTDKIGNKISIKNKFMCSEYIGTEIELNDHKTIVKDKSYIDNVMLKKPFTSEDDLDFVMSGLLNSEKHNIKTDLGITKRTNNTSILNLVINKKMELKQSVLPISIRKTMLLKPA